MSLSNLLLTDTNQASIVNKQKAELYMELYQYAAQDFVTIQDMYIFGINLVTYLTSLEAQLTSCMSIISSHTHIDSEGGSTTPPLAKVSWSNLTKPQIKFTTGMTPNLYMNKVGIGIPSEGPVTLGYRRQEVIPLLLEPTVPPLFTGSV